MSKIGNPKVKRIKLDRNSKAWGNLVQAVFLRDRYRCQCCGNLFPKNMLAPHHKKSVGSGGDDTLDNLISVCQFCHHELHKGNIKL